MSRQQAPVSENLSNDILLSFHSQFAENQRAKEQNFVQIAGYLGAIIVGYAYVYDKFAGNSAAFSLVSVAALTLLCFGAVVAVTNAYNWRRDQAVNARIRRLAGLLGTPDAPFPESYDSFATRASKNFISWMPDILVIYFLIFPIFEILLFLSYANRIGLQVSLCNPDLYITFAAAMFIGALTVTCSAPYFYWQKFKRLNFGRSIQRNTKNSDRADAY